MSVKSVSQQSKMEGFPVKITTSKHQVRKLVFESKAERHHFMKRFLALQGYESPLEQYDMLGELQHGQLNKVFLAKHLASGTKVVIKAL